MSFEKPEELLKESDFDKQEKVESASETAEVVYFFREDLTQRLLNKEVLGLTGLLLGLFWSGFVIGLGLCCWLK